MPELSVEFVAWFFLVTSLVVVLLGAFIIAALSRSEEGVRKALASNAWNEITLFGIWIMGLAGSWGLLGRNEWGRDLLELFCWVLAILTALTAVTRMRALRQQMRNAPTPEKSAGGGVVGIVLFALPVLLFCWGSIVTLRGDAARQFIMGS